MRCIDQHFSLHRTNTYQHTNKEQGCLLKLAEDIELDAACGQFEHYLKATATKRLC